MGSFTGQPVGSPINPPGGGRGSGSGQGTGRGGGSGSGFSRNPQVDFHRLVHQTADIYELHHDVQILSDAREMLIDEAIPHTAQVNQELAGGNITLPFLESSLNTLFDNARDIASQNNSTVIDGQVIAASMKRYCPYLFWC